MPLELAPVVGLSARQAGGSRFAAGDSAWRRFLFGKTMPLELAPVVGLSARQAGGSF